MSHDRHVQPTTPFAAGASTTPAPQQGVGFQCPFCKSTAPPVVNTKITGAGWVLFVILLFLCFPLAIVAVFMQETTRTCSSCGIRLG